MNIFVIAFSDCGALLAGRLFELSERGHFITRKYIARAHSGKNSDFEPFDSVYELTARIFGEADALVFIGACGIAVRAIAPHIKSKLTDPAIVVCDEAGRFAVSLLSGHVGGANLLTEQIAEITGAVPVITTASDSHAALGSVEQQRNLVLGIGCRRGVSAEAIERAATILLWNEKIPIARICKAATIDIKRDEDGLLRFADLYKLPLHFYSASELAAVQGEFTASERVLRTVGVDNVCERAAVLCSGGGELLLKKTARDGVTVAVAEENPLTIGGLE